MDDIEKTLIDLDFNINDCITKEAEVYDSYLNIKNKREDTEDKINKYDKKIEKLNHELDDLKVIRISFLTVPSIGFACFGMAMLFNVPVSLIVGIFALGSVSGFKLADDMVRSKMINASDELLLRRLFPVIDKKNREIKKNI